MSSQVIHNGATMLDAEDLRHNSYISLLIEFAPLFLMAFTILMLKGMQSIKAGYMGRSLMGRFLNLVLTSVVGAALAVGCAAIVPMVYPQATPGALVGVTVFMTIGGVRLVDGLAFKHFGIHLVDSTEMNPAQSEWLLLSDTERAQCMKMWNKHKGKADE